MSHLRLSRRTMLRGAGSIAIALPWLEIMGNPNSAKAAESARRFITVYTPGGSVVDDGQGRNRWRPVGGETDFTLSPILEPLERVRDNLLVIDGLSMMSAVGEQHQAGIIAWLTGTPQADGNGYSRGPSLDQVIASRMSSDVPVRSLQLAVRWGTGKSHGLLHPINCANFELLAPFAPIPPRLDPQAIFTALFGAVDPESSLEMQARIRSKRSILDFVDRRYANLATQLGARDRQKLEQHLTKVRELEQSIGPLVMATGGCSPPERIDTSDYNPTTGLAADDTGAIVDHSSDEAIPRIGQFMMDMLVMALACDITHVASLQWSDTEAKHTFPWLGLSEHHHFYQHDGGFRPVECERIAVWYSEQHAYLLTAMDTVEIGDHTLLDESVVFFGSELAHAPTHGKVDMPFLLAGGGGGLRGGRFLRNEHLTNPSHNNLLSAIANLFGDDRRVFGDPNFASAPLASLT